MAKKMLIDATHPEETRVVVVDGNKVDDFDFESVNKKQLAGNIYLAKVTRVEPSLQAAFVEYGGNRHGFLAFAEIHPDYYQIPVADREALIAEEAALVREEVEGTQGANGSGTGKSAKSRKSPAKKTEAKAETPPTVEDDAPESENTARSRRGGRRRGAKSGQRHDSNGAFDVIDPDGGAREAPITGMETAGEAQAPADPAEPQAAPPEAQAPADPAPVADTDPGERADHDADVAVATDDPSAAPLGAPADVPAAEPAAETVPEASESPTTTVDPSAGAETETIAQDAEAPAAPGEPAASPSPDASVDEASVREGADDPDTAPPRSMAEDAGLGEDDVVRGEIAENTPDNAGAETEGEAGSRAKPRRRRRAKDAPTESAAGEAVAAVAEDAGADEAGAKPAKAKRTRRGTKGKKAAKSEAADERQAKITAKAESEAPTDEVEAPGEVDTVGAEDLREEALATRAIRRRRYKIQDVIKSRQIMLVQVVKEERGNKGAALTTYLSLAGRYCVLMPNTARGGGISRKITNATDRKRLREIVGDLEVPDGMGLIVRTAGAERTRAEIKRDYEFLLRQWEQVRSTTLKSAAPCLIYEEGSLIKRAIRDLYNKEIDQILVEGEAGYREAKDYMKMLMPSHAKNVQQYTDPTPLYIRHQVESYLNGMFSPVVQLKSGGYIVIGVTEALVAIDVNSGRSTREGSIEDTAVKTNLEAADEVARQLRLRDLAGLIVIDFIDMDERKNNAAVEKRMKDRLKTDRARIQVGRISAFGLMEMSRQRLRPGMLEATTRPCPHCHGQGMIRSDESMALAILREIEEEGVKGRSSEVVATMPVGIANYIVNLKRAHLARIEERYDLSVQLLGDPAMSSPAYRIDRAKTAAKPPAAAEQPSVVTASSVVEAAELDAEEAVDEVARPQPNGEDAGDGAGKKRRRGKRGGRRRRAGEDETGLEETEASPVQSSGTATAPIASGDDEDETGDDEAAAEGRGQGKRGRRRNRGKRRGGEDQSAEATTEVETDAGDAPSGPAGAAPSVVPSAEAELAVDAEVAPDLPADPLPMDAGGDPLDVAAEAPGGGEPETGAPILSEEAAADPVEQALPAEMQTEVPVEVVEETPVPDDDLVDAVEATPVPVADAVPGTPEPEVDPSAAPALPAEPETIEDEAPAETTGETTLAAEIAGDMAAETTQTSEPERPKRRGWWSLRR